MHQEYR